MRLEGDWDDVRWYGEVRVDGKVLDPARSLKVRNHSPDGFAWGYGGSGPAQLALAVLLEAGMTDRQAETLYQAFKAGYIQRLPSQGPFVLDVDLQAWARSRGVRL